MDRYQNKKKNNPNKAEICSVYLKNVLKYAKVKLKRGKVGQL